VPASGSTPVVPPSSSSQKRVPGKG
jgi:hypothetical protein